MWVGFLTGSFCFDHLWFSEKGKKMTTVAQKRKPTEFKRVVMTLEKGEKWGWIQPEEGGRNVKQDTAPSKTQTGGATQCGE